MAFKNIVLKLKSIKEKEDVFYNIFKIGILFKGANGLLEIIGGILLFFVSPIVFHKIISFLTYGELIEDPNDVIVRYILKESNGFSISSQYFGIFYLFSHGLIKLFLVISLWKEKIWAYPTAIVVFILFIIYQGYRYTYKPSIFLLLLTIFDIIIIALTWIENKRIKGQSL